MNFSINLVQYFRSAEPMTITILCIRHGVFGPAVTFSTFFPSFYLMLITNASSKLKFSIFFRSSDHALPNRIGSMGSTSEIDKRCVTRMAMVTEEKHRLFPWFKNFFWTRFIGVAVTRRSQSRRSSVHKKSSLEVAKGHTKRGTSQGNFAGRSLPI